MLNKKEQNTPNVCEYGLLHFVVFFLFFSTNSGRLWEFNEVSSLQLPLAFDAGKMPFFIIIYK